MSDRKSAFDGGTHQQWRGDGKPRTQGADLACKRPAEVAYIVFMREHGADGHGHGEEAPSHFIGTAVMVLGTVGGHFLLSEAHRKGRRFSLSKRLVEGWYGCSFGGSDEDAGICNSDRTRICSHRHPFHPDLGIKRRCCTIERSPTR